ncbi:MAG: glutamine--fructose-6-phosphate transaminase (isomerizing), partial [Clostridia bacterium]|nr:glutamine--fructose-6-phosphate transaminase (isomerizing) [Clostridia bacterium]
STIGIAHTRWATHGKPSKTNSHPHTDNTNKFSVVHNGIIENYTDIKKFLMDNGYKFISETDTEVIPNLISYYYTSGNDFLKSVNLACNDLEGSYAIEVLCEDFPDRIIVAKKDSPLVIGTSKDSNYIASDIPAVLSYTKDFYLLEDGDIVEIYANKLNFYDKDLNPIKKKIEKISWDASAIEKNGYDDFMLKEINEQVVSIRETIGFKLNKENIELDNISLSKEFLSNINKIFIVACGTAMHAGLAVKSIFENLCQIPVEVDMASEFRYRNPLVNEHTLAIFISQSGETADTIQALKLAKEKGATTLALSNVIGSSITREADLYIYTHAGPEIAVASTKAYTAQVVLLNIIALYIAQILETVDNDTIEEIKKQILLLPSKVEETLKDDTIIKELADDIYDVKDTFFIGRGIDYPVAMEGSLKLKEISYIHSEAYAGGELKHGPIALVENNFPVIGIMTDKKLLEKSESNLQEVISRGAKTIVITNQKIDKKFDYVIEIPEINKYLSPILSVIPLQLLSYYISKKKGLDVDKPRNLAKSVTVE